MAALVGGSQQSGPSTQLVVTLVGGGNSTHCMAPLLAAAGFPVNILTRRPDDWSKEISVVNEDLGWIRATKIACVPNLITSNPAECIPQSDIVWFCGVPIHHNPALLQLIKPHLNPRRHVFIGKEIEEKEKQNHFVVFVDKMRKKREGKKNKKNTADHVSNHKFFRSPRLPTSNPVALTQPTHFHSSFILLLLFFRNYLLLRRFRVGGST